MTDNKDDVEMTNGMQVPRLDQRDAGAPEYVFDESMWQPDVSVDQMRALAGNSKPRTHRMNNMTPVTEDFTPGVKNSDITAMSNILQNVREVSDVVELTAEHAAEHILTESPASTHIRHSMIKEANAGKEWHIELTESPSGKSLYNVINNRGQKCFFEDLYLQQTAKNLCELLEGGMPLNSREVNTVLYYEEMYRKNYDEARNCKQRYNKIKSTDQQKARIIESKFHNAKTKAKEAASNQKKFLKS